MGGAPPPPPPLLSSSFFLSSRQLNYRKVLTQTSMLECGCPKSCVPHAVAWDERGFNHDDIYVSKGDKVV